MREKMKKLYRFAYVKGTALAVFAVGSGLVLTVSGKSAA